jgi:transposase
VTDLAAIMRRLDALEAQQIKLREERDAYHKLYLDLLERYKKLERGLMGQKSEKLPAEGQLSLAILGMAMSTGEMPPLLEKQEVKTHTRQKPTGRKPLPANLPRIDVEVLPVEVEKEGTDAFERIGQDVTEVLERRPASMVVVRVVKPKFVRKDRDRNDATVMIGANPELPIERGLAGPGMLADSIVRRWQDSLPTNRLEGIYAREGVELARSTIGSWHEQLMPLARRIVEAMRLDAFAQPYLCADATGVLVQAKEQCRLSHFWVLVAPGRHVLFEYTKKHDSAAVDKVLAGYKGYLVADAHAVYDHLYEDGHVKEANCWAHCRRYFFKAMSTDPDRAGKALTWIGALFRVERHLAESTRRHREKIRASRSKPIVDQFFSWCDHESQHVLDDTPISAGIRYARNQRVGLLRFLEDGRLPVHNNISELNLRRQAIGRKNWLFVGSDTGGEVNAVFSSLLASCRMLGVEPWAYLRDILCLLPSWPTHRDLELAPFFWNQTVCRPGVTAALSANPFRRATFA